MTMFKMTLKLRTQHKNIRLTIYLSKSDFELEANLRIFFPPSNSEEREERKLNQWFWRRDALVLQRNQKNERAKHTVFSPLTATKWGTRPVSHSAKSLSIDLRK